MVQQAGHGEIVIVPQIWYRALIERMSQTAMRALLNRRPEILVLAAAGVWGSTGLFVRMAALPPTHIAFFRMLVPVVVIASWFLLRRHRIPREGLHWRLVASGVNAVRMYFFFLAFSLTSVATATVTLYSWPLFAVLFAGPILGERVGPARWGLLVLGFLGVPLLYLGGRGGGNSSAELGGILAMLVSAALHALTVTLLKRARSGGSFLETTFFQNLVGAVVFGVVVLGGDERITTTQIAWALGLGTTVGLVGFTLFFVALHRLSTGVATNLTYFEVVVAATLGTLVLGEPLTWGTVTGALLIGLSLALSGRVGAPPSQPVVPTGVTEP